MRNSIDHKAVKDAIRASFIMKMIIAFILFVVLIISLFAYFKYEIAGAIFFSVVIIFVLDRFLRKNESDYYALPFSRDEQGNHRCIFCGNPGIYRHGKYKSTTRYADCSKCKKNLWIE